MAAIAQDVHIPLPPPCKHHGGDWSYDQNGLAYRGFVHEVGAERQRILRSEARGKLALMPTTARAGAQMRMQRWMPWLGDRLPQLRNMLHWDDEPLVNEPAMAETNTPETAMSLCNDQPEDFRLFVRTWQAETHSKAFWDEASLIWRSNSVPFELRAMVLGKMSLTSQCHLLVEKPADSKLNIAFFPSVTIVYEGPPVSGKDPPGFSMERIEMPVSPFNNKAVVAQVVIGRGKEAVDQAKVASTLVLQNKVAIEWIAANRHAQLRATRRADWGTLLSLTDAEGLYYVHCPELMDYSAGTTMSLFIYRPNQYMLGHGLVQERWGTFNFDSISVQQLVAPAQVPHQDWVSPPGQQFLPV
ncbi:hypothetical protein B0T16DRAFT_450828 [Cercophora newfieldiana]|uniref:Uncharacterized protein n=1 Tax=Cercophora newfieldiana TaxID=92897 RepID=A0AA40CYE0_9PEZI|nr:hypothetical protein B0T16DRAFT_450828 [Cercophora newfieldiana]